MLPINTVQSTVFISTKTRMIDIFLSFCTYHGVPFVTEHPFISTLCCNVVHYKYF